MTFHRTQSPEERFRPLHDLFNQLTGQKRAWTSMAPWKWLEWAKHFDGTDLTRVVTWLKDEIKAGRRFPVSLRFDHLIEDTEKFADDLEQARGAWERSLKSIRPKAATGRPTEVKIVTPAEVLDGDWKSKLEALKRQLR